MSLHDKMDNELTDKIIGCYYKVYNTLGSGFVEKVYENSLKVELESIGLRAECQRPIKVYYSGQIVGEYFADLVVEDQVILELKTTKAISEEHEAQLYNYLKATGIKVGLLLNFGAEPSVKRRIHI